MTPLTSFTDRPFAPPCGLTEAQVQRAVIDHLQRRGVKKLYWFHVPNGGRRGRIEGANFKRLGVKAGVPDLMLIHGGRTYALELKREKGRASGKQLLAHLSLQEAGAIVATAYGLDEAVRQLEAWKLVA